MGESEPSRSEASANQDSGNLKSVHLILFHNQLTLWWSKRRHTLISPRGTFVPRVAETPWLHSVTLPPPTVGSQQRLFNRLLAGEETTLLTTQMRRQKAAFSNPRGGAVRRGRYTAITHRAFCR